MKLVERLICITSICGIVAVSTVSAQSDDNISVDWRNMRLVEQTEPWLRSENAAGLNNISAGKLSYGKLYFGKQNGGLRNYYQSSDSYNWGAIAESIYRLNDNVMLYGKVSYDNFTGKGMNGSTFIDPENTPFDIVEYTEENSGKKNMETYNLVGAISGKLSDRLAIGGRFDFTAANYAKFKDLRHQNKLMDMDVSVGLMYNLSNSIRLGGNYYYKRSTEGLYFKSYGTTDKVFKSLISYGAFFGKVETFGENGYTKETEEKPLFDQYHGGALQLEWNISPNLSWYNQVSYKSRSGYYGKKSPYTIVYSNHDAKIYDYNTSFTFRNNKNIHTLQLGLSYDKLNNRENIYRNENESGGSSDIAYYGELDVAEKKRSGISVLYTANLGVENDMPRWTIRGDVRYDKRDITATVYPYYRVQNLSIYDFCVNVERNFVKRNDMYSLSVGADYHFGNGDKYSDKTYVTPSESQTSPKTSDSYLNEEYEYLTASQLKAMVGFKYTRVLNPSVNLYFSTNYSFGKAFDAEYLGNGVRHEFNLSVGCAF